MGHTAPERDHDIAAAGHPAPAASAANPVFNEDFTCLKLLEVALSLIYLLKHRTEALGIISIVSPKLTTNRGSVVAAAIGGAVGGAFGSALGGIPSKLQSFSNRTGSFVAKAGQPARYTPFGAFTPYSSRLGSFGNTFVGETGSNLFGNFLSPTQSGRRKGK